MYSSFSFRFVRLALFQTTNQRVGVDKVDVVEVVNQSLLEHCVREEAIDTNGTTLTPAITPVRNTEHLVNETRKIK